MRPLATAEATCYSGRITFAATSLWLGVFLAGPAFSLSPPDRMPANKTWAEVTRHFATLKPDQMHESRADGTLLRQIDPQRVLPFLSGFLGKDQPQGVRLNALCALDAAAVPESAAIVENIALDPAEDPRVRYSALWPTLTNFDKDRASEIGIACLRDPERTVRLGAYWLLGRVGGDAAVAALQRQFLTTDEKNLAAQALGHTREPSAIKFLVRHSPLEELRRDDDRRDAFVRAMAATPIADAEAPITELVKGADCYLIKQALPYFRAFLSSDVGPDLVAYFEHAALREKRLRHYPDLWFFANAPALYADATERLRALVREVYPDAEFGTPVAESSELDDETLGAVIAATFGSKPAGLGHNASTIQLVVNGSAPSEQVVTQLQHGGYPVEPASRYEIDQRICAINGFQRIADGQILLEQTFFDSVWGFLVARQNGNWVVAKRERLRILCW